MKYKLNIKPEAFVVPSTSSCPQSGGKAGVYLSGYMKNVFLPRFRVDSSAGEIYKVHNQCLHTKSDIKTNREKPGKWSFPKEVWKNKKFSESLVFHLSCCAVGCYCHPILCRQIIKSHTRLWLNHVVDARYKHTSLHFNSNLRPPLFLFRCSKSFWFNFSFIYFTIIYVTGELICMQIRSFVALRPNSGEKKMLYGGRFHINLCSHAAACRANV